MGKYLLKRILQGLLCVVAVTMIIMIMIYSLLNRDLVFANDPQFTKTANNQRQVYKYQRWEQFGYLDFVQYTDFLKDLTAAGEIDEDTRAAAAQFAQKSSGDDAVVKKYAKQFRDTYEAKGYTVKRLDAVMANGRKLANGGTQQYFAVKDIPLIKRLWKYFSGFITIDNIHKVPASNDIGKRGLTFTLHDPVYGGERFAPAIIGNGTIHKYLLYTDNKFPYIHQNFAQINLGTSYSVNMGVDVFITMTKTQGAYVQSKVTYPTGHTEMSADDLHSATYAAGSRDLNAISRDRFLDDYTITETIKSGRSKMGYSFLIGIISTIMAYLLAVPLGILMARHKDGILDKIGTFYIVFIIAVPSLAYIFLFKAIGGAAGLPTTFNSDSSNKLMYVLPIVSLALPSVANLMKWLRRYMIDQQNADYVKFARSGGLSENEIFSKHILKNAAIPIIQGIPGSVLGCLTGAIITERVYVVPGAGNLLTEAINKYDNGVIVGVSLFYAVLSVVSIILGDVLMAAVDPRISFTEKAR